MSDEELMSIAFSDKRTVQDILRYIFEIGEQKGREDAIDELLNKINKEVDMWWDLEKENSEYDANWYTSIKMLLEQLKENKND